MWDSRPSVLSWLPLDISFSTRVHQRQYLQLVQFIQRLLSIVLRFNPKSASSVASLRTDLSRCLLLEGCKLAVVQAGPSWLARTVLNCCHDHLEWTVASELIGLGSLFEFNLIQSLKLQHLIQFRHLPSGRTLKSRLNFHVCLIYPDRRNQSSL